MYMVHGGSNFGLTAGANSLKDHEDSYQPTITSYDYDAPINEQGSVTNKFTIFRELAVKHVSWSVPEPPAAIPVISIGSFKNFKIASLFANLPTATVTNSAEVFAFESDQLEMYNQGMVVY